LLFVVVDNNMSSQNKEKEKKEEEKEEENNEQLRRCCWSVSAPAKLILFGEHAVVYGKLAVAASLDLRTVVESSPPTDDDVVMVERPNLNTNLRWSLEQLTQLYQLCISSGWLRSDPDGLNSPIPCNPDMKAALFSFCDQDKGAVAFLYLYLATSFPNGSVTIPFMCVQN